MLCSTIIPTVGRPTLARAVESVLAQDTEPRLHEIIVVNDSGRPLDPESWMQSPQVSVVNTNRCERSIACNVGAAIAKGVYLKVLHDDDYLLPGGLMALLSAAESSGCCWIYGGLERVDNDAHFISVDHPEVTGNILALLVAGDCLHLGPALIDRGAFLRACGFDPRLSVGEDYDLECRLALAGNFGRVDRKVAVVRVGREGSTTSWDEVTREYRLVREKILSEPGVVPRLLDSFQRYPRARARVCRAYVASFVLNLKARRLLVALSRFVSGLRLAAAYPVLPSYWRDMFRAKSASE